MTILQPTQSPLGYSAPRSIKAVDSSKANPLALPRKTEESDLFEKQPKASSHPVGKIAVVPTLLLHMVLDFVLATLAGEFFWKSFASTTKERDSSVYDETKAVTLALDEEGIPIPQVFDLEKFKNEDSHFVLPKLCMQLDLLNHKKTKPKNADNIEVELHPAFKWFVEREKGFYTQIKGVDDIHKITAKILKEDLIDGFITKKPKHSFSFDINDLLEKHPTLSSKASHIIVYLERQNLLDIAAFSDLETDLYQLIKSQDSTSNGKFTVENFEQEVFERIQEGLRDCKEKAMNNPSTPIVPKINVSVNEGVQALKGLGHWFRTPTQTLQQTGGEALEKHALNSRWIAVGTLLFNLLSSLAFISSIPNPKKPKNQSTNAYNTS